MLPFSLQAEHQHLPVVVFSFFLSVIKRFQTIHKTVFNFPNVTHTPFALWLLNTVISGSMVPEWLVLPPHSKKVPLLESWPRSLKCGVCMFCLCLCQFPTTPKDTACLMSLVVVKQSLCEKILTMELKGDADMPHGPRWDKMLCETRRLLTCNINSLNRDIWTEISRYFTWINHQQMARMCFSITEANAICILMWYSETTYNDHICPSLEANFFFIPPADYHLLNIAYLLYESYI